MTENSSQLGKYRILEELGKGGFATVYRALDTTLEREVALKVLDPLLMRDETWVERFHREAKAVARLNHPNIVTIHEIGEAEDRIFIAMELIDGPNLGGLIAGQGRLSWEKTLEMLARVSNALDYAHAEGIIHRDLKPANILLDERRGAVLTDFGFARLVSESSMSVSVSGGIVGTPQYIAPEIWDGESASFQTDVYALACITYELITGTVLFAGATPSVVMRKHLIDGPRFPRRWPEGVPSEMEKVLDKALARRPAVRHTSAGDFAADLQDVAAQTADPLATPYRGLVVALSGERWDFALRRADEIMAQDPDYRDVQTLRKRAVDGKAEAERAQQMAQQQWEMPPTPSPPRREESRPMPPPGYSQSPKSSEGQSGTIRDLSRRKKLFLGAGTLLIAVSLCGFTILGWSMSNKDDPTKTPALANTTQPTASAWQVTRTPKATDTIPAGSATPTPLPTNTPTNTPPPDRDGDGVLDQQDRCPGQPGVPEFDGCPDDDGDGFPEAGFPDKQDQCPGEPGTVNGCPDSDGDGIPDKDDGCPNQWGPPENAGCPRDG
jgi:serine/threonine-protein kinase